jgi:hypothetical protein
MSVGIRDFEPWHESPPEEERDQNVNGDADPVRKLKVGLAAAVTIRRQRWLYDKTLPLGELSLLVGEPGLGKSTIGAWLTGHITRGTLPGELYETSRHVFIEAPEDSWETVIAPRLLANGADLTMVHPIQVDLITGDVTGTSYPLDIPQMKDAIRDYKAALYIADPLGPRMASTIDSNKDDQVRRGLQPLVDIAHDTGVSVLGIMHMNKAKGNGNLLNSVMGSVAFGALARAVTMVAFNPLDDTGQERLFGLAKGNLTAGNHAWTYSLHETEVGFDPDDSLPILATQVAMGEKTEMSVGEAIDMGGSPREERGTTADLAEWITTYLLDHGCAALGKDVKAAARKAFDRQLHDTNFDRAVQKANVVRSRVSAYQGGSMWSVEGPTEKELMF